MQNRPRRRGRRSLSHRHEVSGRVYATYWEQRIPRLRRRLVIQVEVESSDTPLYISYISTRRHVHRLAPILPPIGSIILRSPLRPSPSFLPSPFLARSIVLNKNKSSTNRPHLHHHVTLRSRPLTHRRPRSDPLFRSRRSHIGKQCDGFGGDVVE